MMREQLRQWRQIRAEIRQGLPPERRARWDRAMKRARHRYASEIRKYRGIDRLRTMYRAKRR